MKEKQWKKFSIQSVVILICVLSFGLFYSRHFEGNGSKIVMADDNPDISISTDLGEIKDADVIPLEETDIEKPIHADKATMKKRSNMYIRVADEKTASGAAVYIKDDYINNSLSFTLSEISVKNFSVDDIVCYNKGKIISGKAVKKNKSDFIKNISVSSTKLKSGNYKFIVNIKTKKLYEPCLYEIGGEYYISFAEPHKLYDKIVVIDAGHGGIDEGTSSTDREYHEKDYTLLIVQELKSLLDESDIKAYYTRLDDKYVSKSDRAGLANALKADLLVSIHCNASDKGDTTAYGVEALYSTRRTKKNSITNKKLSRLLMNNVEKKVNNRRRGVIKRNGLYLMRHANMPASIIEVGYMTNKSDLKCIRGKDNREKIADGIYKAIEKAFEDIN